MSTVSDPKLSTPTVLPPEASQSTAGSAAATESAATEQTTATSTAVPVDTVETGAPSGQLWGPNKTATTPPPAPPADTPNGSEVDAQVYGENLGLTAEGLQDLADDALAAAFMKLNILDPDDQVETQNSLSEALTQLQQQAIANAKQEIKNLQERIREAKKRSESGRQFGAWPRVLPCTGGAFSRPWLWTAS